MVRLSIEQAAQYKDKWFIAYTKNNCEFKARDAHQGSCLVPVTNMVITKGTKSRVKVVPKFRNYIYIQHDGTKDFFERVCANEYIQYLPGMTPKILPNPVPEPDITYSVEVESRNNLLKHGDRVKIVDGYLKNLVGIIVGIAPQHEFIIEIAILDRTVRETIPREYLIKVEER